MKRSRYRLILLSGFAIALFFATTAFPAQTFVVLDDVVFVRDDPKVASPLESMTVSEIQNEYLKFAGKFPPHFFYGQNIRGELEPGIKDAVKIYGSFGKGMYKRAISGYIDKKRLWQEPPLLQVNAPISLTLQDVNVSLVPEKTARKVLPLYQGEVVETLGRLQHDGQWWIKVKFDNRYGYIPEQEIQPLAAGTVDESSLTVKEVPRLGRNADRALLDNERAWLAQNGFFVEPVVPSNHVVVDDMADLYNGIHSAVFLTSDMYLHAFHLIFDRMLQNIERERLYPEILALTTRLADESARDKKAYAGPDEKLKQALTYNLFFVSVAAKLLNPSFAISPEVSADVDLVVKCIVEASGSMPALKNDIKPGDEDFSMYRVRGHYESLAKKSASEWGHVTPQDPDRLERYFRAMMWYGRRSFPISDDAKTLSAILLVRQLESSGEMKRWEKIDRVLTKVVGKTDDWSPADYGKIVERTYGSRKPRPADIVMDTSTLMRFKDAAAKDLPSARIVDLPTGAVGSPSDRLKSVAGFRLLGMRFTWDAYLFNQLTAPNVPRGLPAATDAMALFGSTAADEVIRGAIDAQPWKDAYYRQQELLKQVIGRGVEKKETTYDSWVSAFSTLFLQGGSKQVFTRSRGWQYKNLNAALGSWTELKHDTILYSKQSGAEAGEGDEFDIPPYDPPSIKGYVEPNPLFFAMAADLASGLSRDLLALGFMTDEYKDKLQSFDALARRAQEIAKKEVDGSRLNEDDYGWIRSASHHFNRGLLLPRATGDIVDPELLKMALIADIATDYLSGSVLEVAVGVPQRIMVVVKDFSGGTRMTTGFVYSWYEFNDTKRWQDSEWRSLVYGSDQERLKKMRPTWYSTFQKPD